MFLGYVPSFLGQKIHAERLTVEEAAPQSFTQSRCSHQYRAYVRERILEETKNGNLRIR